MNDLLVAATDLRDDAMMLTANNACNSIGMVKRFLDKMLKLENPQVLVEVEPVTNSYSHEEVT